MTKKILVVVGTSNVGKSTSIKMAHDRLLTHLVRKHKSVNARYFDSTPKEVGATFQVETCIGITTRGDNLAQVKMALTEFDKDSCAVIVCAAHRKSAALPYVYQFAQAGGYTVEESPKSSVRSSQNAANVAFADALLRWIKRQI